MSAGWGAGLTELLHISAQRRKNQEHVSHGSSDLCLNQDSHELRNPSEPLCISAKTPISEECFFLKSCTILAAGVHGLAEPLRILAKMPISEERFV